ncbi:hypothetical protein GDO78_015251 [Eleutherodactylus coqui]|uniref:Uncharacterized protein n=1 Tax=Eleutherodactylus coqui TaxID=57060 RepID=A0A8J6EDY9_ELECQ|nr:hypothetical protein GDO78_015251 [Eleutherodactylus coqui]
MRYLPMMVVSYRMHMKSLSISQIYPQLFTAKICFSILLKRFCPIIHYRLAKGIKVTETMFNINESTQGRNCIHVQNVGNVLLKNHILFYIRKFTQERSRIYVQNVGNVLSRNHILIDMREVTQEKSRIHVQNVRNVLIKNRIFLYMREVT